jgi:PST family polysaccharide transporter
VRSGAALSGDELYYATPVTDVRARVASGAVWTTTLHIGSRAAELVFTAILARLLAPTEFGVVAAALVFIQFAKLFVEIGIGATIVQLPDLTRADVRTAGTLVALNALLFFALAQLLAPIVAAGFAIPQVENALRVLAFVFLFQAIGIVPENLLVRRLDAPRVMIAEMASKLLGFGGVGALCAYLGMSYWSLVIGALTEAFIKAVTLALIVRPPIRPMWNRTSVRRLLTRGVGFSFSRVLNFLALSADKMIAGRLLGAAALGIYGRAYALMSIPADLYARIGERLVFPALAVHQENPERLRRAFLTGTSLTAAIGMPLSVVLVILSPEIIGFLLGPRWTAVVAPLTILVAASYVRLGAKISGSLLRATGSIRALVWTQAGYAGAVTIGCILAAPFGVNALAWAVSAAATAFFVLISAMACRRTATSLPAFASAHVQGALLCLLIGSTLFAFAALLRAAGLPDVVILLAAGSLLGLMGATLVAIGPAWLLGRPAFRLASDIRVALQRRLRARRVTLRGAATKETSA